jgi:undecaprenyl-diphosphatase
VGDLIAAVFLGAVQGVTEFLPISSSAHLILSKAFFGWDAERFGLAFDVACHVGTLAAVLLFFRQDLMAMARRLPDALSASPGPDGQRIRLIAAGTVPVVIVGLTLADVIEAEARTPFVAACALAVGAGLLLLIERMQPAGIEEGQLGIGGALLIGVAQAAALVPGVSRSGATIAAGMALGFRREVAARFTFLMSVPAVTAAAAREALELAGSGFGPGDAMLFLAGMAVSAVVGYLTVKYFIRFLAANRLDVFAWYRILLALATFAWLWQGGSA